MSLSDKRVIVYDGDVKGYLEDNVREAVKELKQLLCKCKDVSKEKESAYKRAQIGFNELCVHHKIDEIFGEELT